eukprot:TRINITY_DN7848_c0_g2_i3.p1 TRINITY_DN7848_c0_g2~~TRINITY_DN7848_c0_g2_i3.p1  ORF type:complete len:573 (+),score=74.09 TRINITY_DN7848_c0_g2_i3:55-1773(+)
MAVFIANSKIALLLTLGLFRCVTLVQAYKKKGELVNHTRANASMLPSRDDLSSKYIANIEQILGHDHVTNIKERVPPIEAQLQTILKSFPQDEQGRYGHMVVRHTLHRFFLKKHGWHMLGFDEPSSGSALPQNLPEYLRGPLEARLDSHGLTAHESAVMAAALENLVNRETMKYFDQAFVVMGMSANTNVLPIKTADSLIATFMAMYIQSYDLETLKRRTMFLRPYLMKKIAARYVSWPELRAFASETLMESVGTRETITNDELREVAEHIVDGYGRFQNRECDDVKTRLLKLEDEKGHGRVPLGNFYKLSLEENAPFNESRAYLTNLGAIEEAEADTPRLLVSNYVLSFANCQGISAYHTHCCITECDNVLEHLEREIAAPDAEPERIAALIQSFSSKYTPASGTLQPKLVQRLHSIADASTGRVTLHSRAFALLLHHVFPRECPYPHVWNGSRPMDMQSFKKATGVKSVEAGLNEMRSVVEKWLSRSALPPAMKRADDEPQWSNEEQVYAQAKPLTERSESLSWIAAFAVLAAVALLLAALAVCSLIANRSSGTRSQGRDASKKQQFVAV